jgi:hypothetical protein
VLTAAHDLNDTHVDKAWPMPGAMSEFRRAAGGFGHLASSRYDLPERGPTSHFI